MNSIAHICARVDVTVNVVYRLFHVPEPTLHIAVVYFRRPFSSLATDVMLIMKNNQDMQILSLCNGLS